MAKGDETFGERMRKIALWQWGLICLSAAGFAGAMSNLQSPPKNSAEAAGRGAAIGLFVVIGLVLIALHFVLPKRNRKPPAAKSHVGGPKAKPTAPGMPPRRPGNRA